MVWDKDELKKAFEHSTAFLELDEAQRHIMSQRFNDVYNRLPQKDRDAANPVSIARALDETQTEIRMPNCCCRWNWFFSQVILNAALYCRFPEGARLRLFCSLLGYPPLVSYGMVVSGSASEVESASQQ